jgi:hypothetical protein
MVLRSRTGIWWLPPVAMRCRGRWEEGWKWNGWEFAHRSYKEQHGVWPVQNTYFFLTDISLVCQKLKMIVGHLFFYEHGLKLLSQIIHEHISLEYISSSCYLKVKGCRSIYLILKSQNFNLLFSSTSVLHECGSCLSIV